jgi:hypothetical protein
VSTQDPGSPRDETTGDVEATPVGPARFGWSQTTSEDPSGPSIWVRLVPSNTSLDFEGYDVELGFPVDEYPEEPPVGDRFGWRQTIPDDPDEPSMWARLLQEMGPGSRIGGVEEVPARVFTSGSSVAHPVTGQSLRAFLTIGLTAAVVAVVITAMIMGVPPGNFAQYVSPITGLAGLALGYWFGTEKGR